MPDITDMLGKKELTEDQDSKENPLTATPDGAKEGENPLEAMDKISKSKPEKKDNKDRSLDSETIEQMLMNGENTDGMFAPDVKEDKDGQPLFSDRDDKAKVKVGKEVEPKGKYKDVFKNDLLKHPDQYKVKTPEGEMTISEAISRGYNPITKTFEKEHNQKDIKDKYLGSLNEADRASIEALTSPSAAQVAPADAEKYGLNPGSPMIRQPAEEEPSMQPPVEEPPMPEGSPVGNPVGTPQESQAAGGLDINALLGGK